MSWFAVLLAALVLLAGCQAAQPPKPPTTDYRVVPLTDAPADVRTYYEQMKAIPGLYVFARGGQTYLLLIGGKLDQQPGMRVEVFDVQTPFNGPREVRILAALRPGQGATQYPYAVIQMDTAPGLTYRARLSADNGLVTELPGMSIDDK
jgi:hypothetical protein